MVIRRSWHSDGARLIRLGWPQLAVVCAGLVAVVLVVGIAFSGEWYDLYVRRVAIRDFENIYGFRTGPVTVHLEDYSYEHWGIVSVTPDGEFAALRVRQRDLLYDLRGRRTGAMILYEALMDASTGRRARSRSDSARSTAIVVCCMETSPCLGLSQGRVSIGTMSRTAGGVHSISCSCTRRPRIWREHVASPV
jgi:hypothetical protein